MVLPDSGITKYALGQSSQFAEPRGGHTADQKRLSRLSRLLFGRELFLPVSAWVLENRRADVLFTAVQTSLRESGLKAPNGPVSDELRKLKDLGMLRERARVGTAKPLRFRRHALWTVVQAAIAIADRWRG
jgi:hypothetical protein